MNEKVIDQQWQKVKSYLKPVLSKSRNYSQLIRSLCRGQLEPMKPPQPRELPWSWERSPGWRGQSGRIKHRRRRLVAASGSPDIETTFDLALGFFISCYHLRDWLERSGDLTRDALDGLFARSLPLRTCADIANFANFAKHYGLTRTPHLTRQLSLAREYEDPGHGWFGADGALRVLSDGRTYDALDLAAACEADWEAFLRHHTRDGAPSDAA